jgi:hypothetical protein
MIDIGNTVNTRQSRTGIRIISAIERNISRYIRENRVDSIILNVRRGIINSDYIIGNNGDSLLHYAIRYKKCDVVSALLNILNVSITYRNFKGETAFFTACERGLIFFVKMFLTWRQNHSTYIDISDNNGMTPLLIAHSRLHKPICEHLIFNGANFNLVSRNGYFIENVQFTYRRAISLVNRHRVTSPIRTFESPQPFVTIRRRIGFTPCIAASDSSIDEVSLTSSHLKNEYIEMLIELKKTCNICFEPYKKDEIVILKKCEHAVCKSCFPRLENCHMCREKII